MQSAAALGIVHDLGPCKVTVYVLSTGWGSGPCDITNPSPPLTRGVRVSGNATKHPLSVKYYFKTGS